MNDSLMNLDWLGKILMLLEKARMKDTSPPSWRNMKPTWKKIMNPMRQCVSLSLTSTDASRPYSNLHGKLLVYGNKALLTDHVGFYSKDRLVTGEQSNYYNFIEEYPHQATGWLYEDLY